MHLIKLDINKIRCFISYLKDILYYILEGPIYNIGDELVEPIVYFRKVYKVKIFLSGYTE